MFLEVQISIMICVSEWFLEDYSKKKKKHSGAPCESSLTSITSLMEKPDVLHKINDFIHKDTEYNTLDVKTCPRSRLLFVHGVTACLG